MKVPTANITCTFARHGEPLLGETSTPAGAGFTSDVSSCSTGTLQAENVKVAVRVRPFNGREKERKSTCIIKMSGAMTTIVNPEDGEHGLCRATLGLAQHHLNPGTPRSPQSLNAHSPLTSATTLSCPAMTPRMPARWMCGKTSASASSKTPTKVGSNLRAFATRPPAKLALDSARPALTCTGYNCSLFAYGQTGAGKSYSMMGYGEDKGIIPIGCSKIFDRINSNTDDTLSFVVTCSMLEIYMEKVRDLFNPKDGSDLKVRNDPKKGFYVERLTASEVDNYEQIESLMDVGTAARTVASTNMNATSSRAHTIFQIGLKQTKVDAESMKATDKTSLINLIDLAGSERQKGTGATGDRLKEGAAINLSLSSLGNCISALAKNSDPKQKKRVRVPYRDSVLTMLLQNSLGGNAKTIMIAAVSPASINYDETLSTLRYADRAKQIKNKAVVNEDPNERLIRQLKDEIEKLKAALGGAPLPEPGASGGAAPSVDVEAMRAEMEAKIKAELMAGKQEGAAATAGLLEQGHAHLRADGLMTAEEKAKAQEMAKEVPHLRNLNEDTQLDRQLYYFFEEGKEVSVGRKGGDPAPTIPLAGLSIQPSHATVQNTEGKVVLTPQSGARVVVNGVEVKEATELGHRSRVLFGNNHVFLVVLPAVGGEDVKAEGEPDELPEHISFDYAMDETNRAQREAMEAERRKQEEKAEAERKAAEARLAEMAAKMEEEKARAQAEALEKAQQANEEEQKRLMEEAARKQAALEKKLQEQIEESKRLQRKREKEMRERSVLDEKLLKTIPLVNEANAMADEMGKKDVFEVKLMPNMEKDAVYEATEFDDEEDVAQKEAMDTEVYVRVHQKGSEAPPAQWHYDKFMNRLYIMREMYQQFQSNSRSLEGTGYEGEKDPFYDPPAPQVIGKATIYLNALLYNLRIDEATPIIDYKGVEEGELLVRIIPHVGATMPETEDDEEDDMPEELSELVGKHLNISICVDQARGVPANRSNFVHVKWKFFLEGGHDFTEPFPTKTSLPEFKHTHTYSTVVTEELIKYVSHEAIEFEVWGTPDDPSGRKLSPPTLEKRKSAQDEPSATGAGGAAAGGEAAPAAAAETPASESPPPTFTEEEKEAIKASTEAGEELSPELKAKVEAYQAWAAEHPGSDGESEACCIM